MVAMRIKPQSALWEYHQPGLGGIHWHFSFNSIFSIRGILEEYASLLCANASCEPPTFLQLSGLRVEYDIWADSTLPRVTSLLKHCPADPSLWCELDPETLYPVALPSFLANGGSRTLNFPAWIESREVGENDFQALVDFVVEHSPIANEQEGRITIRYHP